MKNLFCTLSLIVIFGSCSGQSPFGKPEVDPAQIQSQFIDWWTYQYNNIMLSRDFVALDANTKEITKEQFLEVLSQGKYIPIRLESDAALFYYKLFKLDSKSDSSIEATIVETAFNEIQNLKKKGQAFPKFSFQDLNGNLITNENLKGKTVVLP